MITKIITKAEQKMLNEYFHTDLPISDDIICRKAYDFVFSRFNDLNEFVDKVILFNNPEIANDYNLIKSIIEGLHEDGELKEINGSVYWLDKENRTTLYDEEKGLPRFFGITAEKDLKKLMDLKNKQRSVER